MAVYNNTSANPTSRTTTTRCYGCEGVFTLSERLREHVTTQIGRRSHPRPPQQWLDEHGLIFCDADGHPPWVCPAARPCIRCTRLGNVAAIDTASLRCWECSSGKGIRHCNAKVAAGQHGAPPSGWLEANRLAFCSADGHVPWVHAARLPCSRCESIRGSGSSGSSSSEPADAPSDPVSAAAVDGGAGLPAPRSAGRKLAEFAAWLHHPDALAIVERATECAARRAPRRFLPKGAAHRRIAANTMLDIANAALDKVPAAQALLPFAPRVLLARHTSVAAQIIALMDGKSSEEVDHNIQPSSSATEHHHTRNPVDLWVERVRVAVVGKDFRSINRLLDDGWSGSASVTDREAAQKVLDLKFPFKPEGELVDGADGEADWARERTNECGGAPALSHSLLSQKELIRWARAKRDRAADVGGYSGRLILELHEIDPAVSAALAKVWSLSPEEWAHRGAAFATWRLLKGSFIPQPSKPLPRPVATASVPRRAWGGAVVRSIREAATKYCEERGQYGLSRAGGQAAYVIGARVLHALGADILVDDRTNSFHEVHRSAVVGACSDFIEDLDSTARETVGRNLVQLMKRTFIGTATPSAADPSSAASSSSSVPMMTRSTYVFGVPGIEPRIHHALCQGSSESSLLEAITYARNGPALRAANAVRCELHDDGYTAALPSVPIDIFRRAPATDGSRLAEGKDRVTGPRADSIMDTGLSKAKAPFVLIAGVPVGRDLLGGLAQWETRYHRKLGRLREIAGIDRVLAASAASAVGGPAGLANHILRAVEPTDNVMAVWKRVDDAWVDLWADILLLSDKERATSPGPTIASIRNRLFLGRGSLALHQISAADAAPLRYAQGIAQAATHLARILQRADIPFDRTIWDALGATAWRSDKDVKWDAASLAAVAKKRVATCEVTFRALDTGRIKALKRRYPDAEASVVEGGPPNLYVAWLRLRPPGGGRGANASATMTPKDGAIALRRLFRLTIHGPSTGIPPPRRCLRCGAASNDLARNEARRNGPRKVVDGYGEHALTCILSGGETQRRHNEVAYAIRDCAIEAGFSASCSDGVTFDSHNGRPADIFVRNHEQFRAGLAIDCTIVTASNRGAATAAAEERKRKKYKAEVDKHFGLGFSPFALDLDGGVGPEAWALIQNWARRQATIPTNARQYIEALDWCVATLAHALVNGSVRHIRAYYDRRARDAIAEDEKASDDNDSDEDRSESRDSDSSPAEETSDDDATSRDEASEEEDRVNGNGKAAGAVPHNQQTGAAPLQRRCGRRASWRGRD